MYIEIHKADVAMIANGNLQGGVSLPTWKWLSRRSA